MQEILLFLDDKEIINWDEDFAMTWAMMTFGKEKQEIKIKGDVIKIKGGFLGDAVEKLKYNMPYKLEIEGVVNFTGENDFETDLTFCIGKSLFSRSKKFIAHNLQKVGGDLSLASVEEFSATSLQEVGGLLDLRNAKQINLPNLKNVGKFIWINKEKVEKLNIPDNLQDKIRED